jgi:hypothetical protein
VYVNGSPIFRRRSSRRAVPKLEIEKKRGRKKAEDQKAPAEHHASHHVVSPNVIAKREGADPAGVLSIGLVA